jgi:PAS domain S-box-containing protein
MQANYKNNSFFPQDNDGFKSLPEKNPVNRVPTSPEPIDRYRTLMQGVAEIIWEADATGEFRTDIPQWSAFTGQTLESMQQWGWLDAIHPEDRDRVKLAWQTAIDRAIALQVAEYPMCQVEYRLRHHEGYYRWMSVHGVPVFNPDGTVQKWMGFHTDIEDLKNATSAVRSQAAEISQLHLLLTQSIALADRRNREIDQFTYTVSHDLRAPLRAVTNLSQWIEDDLTEELAAEGAHQLQLLRSRVGRMEALIDGLLAYSRISRMEVSTERVVVVELIAEIIDLLAPPDGLTIEVDDDLPTLDTKRWFLQQVFAHLIDNAIVHHDRTNGHIHISGHPLTDGYEFTVADDGPGIPPAQHEFVFGIFNTLGQKTQRTGVGLAIVKKIVESEGGKIELSSATGSGTKVQFTWLQSPTTGLLAA